MWLPDRLTYCPVENHIALGTMAVAIEHKPFWMVGQPGGIGFVIIDKLFNRWKGRRRLGQGLILCLRCRIGVWRFNRRQATLPCSVCRNLSYGRGQRLDFRR